MPRFLIKRVILSIYLLFPAFAWAGPVTETPARVIGIDYTLPYIFTVNGNGFNDPDHQAFGLVLHHFVSNNVSVGARFSFDIEEDQGRFRQFIVAPGVMYQWFQGRTWMPFVRTDFPVIVKGAFNNDGSDNKRDVGFILGFGIAWNIGNQMGIPNLLFRYDFNAQYYLGFGDAQNNFGVEFARFGIDYRF